MDQLLDVHLNRGLLVLNGSFREGMTQDFAHPLVVFVFCCEQVVDIIKAFTIQEWIFLERLSVSVVTMNIVLRRGTNE